MHESREKELEYLAEQIGELVRQAFESPQEICAQFFDSEPEVLTREERMEFVREQLRAALTAFLAEQQGWPAVTDNDRLDAAFAELNQAGIVARQNFSCCGTCAHSDIWHEIEADQAAGKLIRGYASYDVQCIETAARDQAGVALNYGSTTEGEEAALEIARLVVDTLDRHGVRVAWDGRWDRRILVTLDWKRRRPMTDGEWMAAQ